MCSKRGKGLPIKENCSLKHRLLSYPYLIDYYRRYIHIPYHIPMDLLKMKVKPINPIQVFIQI